MSTNFITPWQYFQLVAPGQQNMGRYVKCFGETNLEKKREYTYIYYTEKKREKEREQMEEKKPAASGLEIQGL